jgi:hypothetical protein
MHARAQVTLALRDAVDAVALEELRQQGMLCARFAP